MGTQAIAKKTTEVAGWTGEQVDLIKRTIARGASDDELTLFLHLCTRTGLDPFARQVYCLKRRENIDGQWQDRMTFQTGIDGYRLIADRTGKYTPGREPTFEYRENQLLSATAYVKKQTADGTWHEIAATAHYSEYVALKKDGNPNRMWSEKPHVMLAKCAEALALRRAFPAELSGLYTEDEMGRTNETHDAEFTPARPALPAPARTESVPSPKTNGPQPSNLPANGAELLARLQAKDAQLAKEGVIKPAALLNHVAEMGHKVMGLPADIGQWSTPQAIQFAVDTTKQFLDARKAQPQPAARPQPEPDGIAFYNELTQADDQLYRDGVLHNDEDPTADEKGKFREQVIDKLAERFRVPRDPRQWTPEAVAFGRTEAQKKMEELQPA